MHERIVAGTDVAMIGVWDADRARAALPRGSRGWTLEALEEEVEAGRLFLVHTGGDGDCAMDLYVDEDAPEAVRKATFRMAGEFLLSVPGGRLVVGGVEDYGAAEPRQTTDDISVTIPPGAYRLRCHVSTEAERQPERSLPEVMRDALVPEDLAYYRLRERSQLKVALMAIPPLLLFPVLVFPLGWKLALAATAVVAWPYGSLLERWSRRREAADLRWQRLNKVVERAWRAAQAPVLILELRGIADPAALKGGSIHLDQPTSRPRSRRSRR